MSLSLSPRTSSTSDTEKMWVELDSLEDCPPSIEEHIFQESDPVRKYSLCFILNGCDFTNKPGNGHKCCENHFSETTRKVICAFTSLTFFCCMVTPIMSLVNCHIPSILTLSATQPAAAFAESAAISSCEATTAVFCIGTPVYCSCHHCKDQNV